MRFILLSLWSFFLLSNIVYAKDDLGVCPNEKVLKVEKYFEKIDSNCDQVNYKRHVGKSLLHVHGLFDQDVHDLKNDWVLHSDVFAKRAVSLYRKYRSCLDLVCMNILNICDAQSKALKTYSYCQRRSQLHKQIQKQGLSSLNEYNNSRKSRSFFREKARFFERKMHEWFVPVMKKLVNNYSNFSAKIDVFIRHPVGS